MPPAGQPVAPSVAWAGLFATGAGALLAGLSSQIHGLAASDIGGALGLSADDASWVTTAGSAAEGAAVIAAAPLAAALGYRRVLLGAAIATGSLALMVVLTVDGSSIIAFRFAQGFAAGLLPVLMMTWSMRAFPPRQRGLTLMLFAFASSAPSAAAAYVAGTVTARLGGLGGFAWDILWTPVVVLIGLVLVPREELSLGRLRQMDWIGYVLTAIAVMTTLVVLSQGERRFWLDTLWMQPLVASAVICAALALIWLLVAKSPLLDLTLLSRPTFAIGLSEAFSLRFALLLASFAVPQALGRLHAFRPEQAGEAILWMAAGQLVGFPLAYLWVNRLDGRWSLAAGLATFSAAALAAAMIDPSWEGAQFSLILIAAGFGQGFYLTSVMTFATFEVPAPAGQTAAGLFNLTRVLGTAGATAAVGYILRMRENTHSADLVTRITDGNDAASARLAELTMTYASVTSDAAAAQAQALGALSQSISIQAYTLAFSDVFIGIAVVLGVFSLLVPALPRIAPFREPKH